MRGDLLELPSGKTPPRWSFDWQNGRKRNGFNALNDFKKAQHDAVTTLATWFTFETEDLTSVPLQHSLIVDSSGWFIKATFRAKKEPERSNCVSLQGSQQEVSFVALHCRKSNVNWRHHWQIDRNQLSLNVLLAILAARQRIHYIFMPEHPCPAPFACSCLYWWFLSHLDGQNYWSVCQVPWISRL